MVYGIGTAGRDARRSGGGGFETRPYGEAAQFAGGLVSGGNDGFWEHVFYYHSLIVRWIAGVGKGASVSVQGLLIVALSAGKDLAYAGGILRYAQNDRAGHYQVLGLDGQLKDPVSVAGMGFCGFDHYGKGPRGSAHGGPVVPGPEVGGGG